jgi:hypothetical protein
MANLISQVPLPGPALFGEPAQHEEVSRWESSSSSTLEGAAPKLSLGLEAFGVSAGPPEGTVKEVLQPLLRQWIDENMSRVVSATLRDELRETKLGNAGLGPEGITQDRGSPR